MNRISPVVPDGCTLIGDLYHDENHLVMTEDMAECQYQDDDLLVWAGWYGEGNGTYRIVAMRGLDQLAEKQTRDLTEAVRLFEEMCREYKP